MSSADYDSSDCDEKSPLLSDTQSNSVSQNSSSNGTSPTSNQKYDSIENVKDGDRYRTENTSTNVRFSEGRNESKNNLELSETSETETDSSEGQSVRGFSFCALSRGDKMILASVCMADFLSYLCLSLLAPFFPQEAEDKNVNSTISGWIFGVFALAQVVFSPIFGKLLPYVGLKFMYVAGLFLAGGTTVLFGCLAYVDTEDDNTVFIVFCFLLRIVLSLGCTSLNTACYALTAKAFPDHIATVFGIGEVFVGVGFMSGPAVGGVLYGLGGFLMPFLVIGVLLLICVPINWCILPADDEVTSSENNVSSLVLLRSPTVIITCCAIICAAFIWSILDPTLEPHLREFDLGPEIVGILFLLMSAFYAIFSPIWGWLADKVSDNRLLLVLGFLFSGGGMLILGPSTLVGFPGDYNELWLNILALCFLGIAASLALIPTFDIFIDVADELGFEDDMHTYGLVAGLWGSMYAFGDFLGPALGGTLYEYVGFQWCCTITAGACFTMTPLLFFNFICDKYCCKKKKSPKTVSTVDISSDNRNRAFTESSTQQEVLVDSWKGPEEEGDMMASYPPHLRTVERV